MAPEIDTDPYFVLDATVWPVLPLVPVGVLGVATRGLPVDLGPARFVGAALFLAGVGWYLWAVAALLAGGGSPVGTRPRELVSAGPFAYSRNPMFLGIVVALLGEGLFFSSALAVGAAVGSWWLFDRIVVDWEERHNRRSLGDAYEKYRREVPRWIGPL